MADMDCEAFEAQSAELALGILDGRERADALAHLAQCPSCRQSLLALSDLADGLVELIPPAEPPAGFETRVLGRLAGSPRAPLVGQQTGGRRARRRPLVLLSAAAAAVVLALGGWAVGHGASKHPANEGNPVLTAALWQGKATVGQVIATTGSHPWIYMMVNAGRSEKSVICQVREGKATTVTIGSFNLDNGYGYWSAAIPETTARITGAQLLSATGSTIATATFPTKG